MPNQKSLKKLSLLFFSIILAIIWTFDSLQIPQTTSFTLNVWMLDVGQGESVLVKEPSGKTVLFDGGPDDSVLSEVGEILPPWDREIDLVVLSHNHSDHIRGLISVLERYTVKELWISGAVHTTDDYRAFLEVIKEKKIAPKIVYFTDEPCSEICPQPIPFGETTLQIYHPLENMTGELPKDQHDATVAVKITYKDESVFLTGDLNEGHEKDMIKACKPINCTLKADILQIPHHGSASGLSEDFLKAVSPTSALIPVGLDNKFHHPRQVILDRLTAAHIPIYRTDLDGQIHVQLDGEHYTINTTR